MRQRVLYLFLVSVLLRAATATAHFSTIINAPPTVIADDQSIGSHTQLNVLAGGTVGNSFAAGAVAVAGSDIEVNISGGTVGDNFDAFSGTVVNITGGSIGSGFSAEAGSVVNVSGGVTDNNFGVWGGVANVSGGTIESFYVWPGGVANISGGAVGTGVYGLNVNRDTLVNITGGRINGGIAYDESVLNISGGVIADELDIRSGSLTSFYGGEFRLDGELVAGLSNPGDAVPINVPAGAILSGTLADGTPFVFTSDDEDSFADGSITLRAAALPAVGPAQINAPADQVPLGIRAGQSLTVASGGVVADDFQAGRGSEVNVTGGTVGENLEALNATINVSGGNVGRYFDAFDGTVVNVTGGTIQRNANAFGGSVFNISGGTVEDFFLAHAGSHANIAGGFVGGSAGDSLKALAGSVVEISGGTVSNGFEVWGDATITGGILNSLDVQAGGDVTITNGTVNALDVRVGGLAEVEGGTFRRARAYAGGELSVSGGFWGDNFDADASSSVHIYGGEFRIDGVPIAGLETEGNSVAVNVPAGAVLSGTLADGTSIAYSSQNFDTFADGALALRAAALPPPGPASYQVPADAAPTGLRQGQSLVLSAGGQLGENFTAAWGSSVTITGGNVAKNFEAVGATVAISGGFVTSSFDAFRGSVVNITGGVVSGMAAQAGSVVNVGGGTVSGMVAQTGSVVNVSGGTVNNLTAQACVVTISGGNIANVLQANDGSVVNISGGTVGNGAVANSGGVMNISGGTIGNNFKAASGGVVNLSHGSVGNSADALAGSVFNMYGGTVGTDFDADALSNVTLFGTQFILNGVNITNTLPYNTPTLITNRNVPFAGLLADNSAFAFDLYSTNASARDYFASTAALMVTRVLPGDFNRDGTVNAADYVTYRNGFGTLYSQLDYTLWRSNFGLAAESGGSLNNFPDAAIPEPSALAIVIAGILAMLGSTTAIRLAANRLTGGAAHRHNYG